MTNPLSSWPEPTCAATKKETIDLSNLPLIEKRVLWAEIREKNPELAALLQHLASDEQMQQFIETFQCTISIYTEDLQVDGTGQFPIYKQEI